MHLVVLFIQNIPSIQPVGWRALTALEADEESLESARSSRHFNEDDPDTIRHVEPCMKVVFIIAVPFVRTVIAGLLTFAGVKFIYLQTDLSSSVLKVIALRFIITMDEILMQAGATQFHMADLTSARIYSPGTRIKCGAYRGGCWETGIGGVVWIVISLILWFSTYWFIFLGETRFRESCLEYGQVFPKALNLTTTYSVMGAIRTLENWDEA